MPAAELRGTAVRHLRPVRVALPGGESLAQRLRHSLKQQLGLIQRAPLAPEVWVTWRELLLSGDLVRWRRIR